MQGGSARLINVFQYMQFELEAPPTTYMEHDIPSHAAIISHEHTDVVEPQVIGAALVTDVSSGPVTRQRGALTSFRSATSPGTVGACPPPGGSSPAETLYHPLIVFGGCALRQQERC